MSRLHYLAAVIWLLASVGVLTVTPASSRAVTLVPPGSASGPEGWFRQVRASCNALEVELALQQSPPPSSLEGAGYAAACLAIAGRIDAARQYLTSVEGSDRWKAAAIVFDVAHPIADAGDDRSAGPIMGLVVEFWPNHYMALYHAGMANYAIGEMPLARSHLTSFLHHYQHQDGWRRNAETVLRRLGGQDAE